MYNSSQEYYIKATHRFRFVSKEESKQYCYILVTNEYEKFKKLLDFIDENRLRIYFLHRYIDIEKINIKILKPII